MHHKLVQQRLTFRRRQLIESQHLIAEKDHKENLLAILASYYRHSSIKVWESRLKKGEITINKTIVTNDKCLIKGDEICWSKPPWREPSIPTHLDIIYDNNDLLVINKPSGLPVIPGGGFLEHT